MKKKKDIKKNLLSHSEAKVNLLGEYISRYLNIIYNDRYTNEINIYDLFCGAGIYDDGGEGSPVVILRAIKDVFDKKHSKTITTINCYFNDLEESKVKKLESYVEDNDLSRLLSGKITFSSIDYKKYLENLEENTNKNKNQKTFIFIDPYEYKHIKINHIKELMKNKKTEVLLWMPTQQMYRFEKNGTPTALKDFIEELVPYEKWKKSSSVNLFVNELKNAFQLSMGSDYYVDNFTIQKDKSTCFCLFFFTSHIKGFEKMLESKWKIDQKQGKGWNYSGNQLSLFIENKTNELAERLSEFLNESEKSNGDIFRFTLVEGFLPAHTNEIFKDWQGRGKLEVLLSNGEKSRDNSFYIGYKYFKSKEEYSKVIFKIHKNGTI